MRLGFLVNPIAGMGGPLALKGTDGACALRKAEASGRERTSPARGLRAVRRLAVSHSSLEILCASGDMGDSELSEAGIEHRVVYTANACTTRDDTMTCVRVFVENKVELILFAGGDGTARDIVDVVGTSIPLVGVPSGVKMHSSVFAHSPEEAADLVVSFARTRLTREGEVMDVDEEAFREGVVSTRLFGTAAVPDDPEHLQPSKQSYSSGSAQDEAEELGEYVAGTMEPEVLYIIGPGSTTACIARALGQRKTLLGVDVYLDGRLLEEDADEKALLEALSRGDAAKVVVTPIGAQGFIFGRGNQQISHEVVRRIGPANLVIMATPTKLRHTPVLRVDTGDPELDAELRGTAKVTTGYRRRKLVRVL